MGFTPQQVNEMSVWQFEAALNGFVKANSPSDGKKLTEDEADDLFDWIERDKGGHRVLSTQTYTFDDTGGALVPAGVVTFEA